MAQIDAELVLQQEFRNRVGALTDPDTVSGWILEPGAAGSKVLTFVRASVGIWESIYTPRVDGEFTWRGEGTGAVVQANERHFTVPPRKVPLPLPTAIPQIPIISRGAPVYARVDTNVPANVTDGAYASLSRSIVSPNVDPPVWWAIDLRSVSPARRTHALLDWRGTVTTYYGGGLIQGQLGSTLGTLPGSNYISMARNYKIQGHISSGSLPGSTDPGWVDLVTVTDNNFHTRIHSNLNLSTYNWVRLIATAANGASGNDDVALEIDVRDITNGIQDSIFAYGDSITEEAFGIIRPDNALWVNIGPFQDAIESATNRWAPLIIDAGSIGWTAADGDTYKADFIGTAPCKYVLINFGSNDANVANINLNTIGGANSLYVKQFKTHLQSMVAYCISLGKTCVIPHIIYGDTNAWTVPNLLLLNAVIDQVIAANPGNVLAGPDFYAFFGAHTNLLRDHLHPTYDNSVGAGLFNGLTGYENYNTLWLNWFITHLYT